MRTEKFAFGLTLINIVLLALVLSGAFSGVAQGDPQVLRGRGLEIVDDRGRVRASIKVHVPTTTSDGKTYSKSVVLRLVNPNGAPVVKIAASEQRSGLAFIGSQGTYVQLSAGSKESSLRFTNEPGYVQLQLSAEGKDSTLKLTNAQGREQVLK